MCPSKLWAAREKVEKSVRAIWGGGWDLSLPSLPELLWAACAGTRGATASPERLELKEEAMVMCTKNNFEAGYVNGTLARVVEFDGTEHFQLVVIHECLLGGGRERQHETRHPREPRRA